MILGQTLGQPEQAVDKHKVVPIFVILNHIRVGFWTPGRDPAIKSFYYRFYLLHINIIPLYRYHTFILLKAQEYFGCNWYFIEPGFTCFQRRWFNLNFMISCGPISAAVVNQNTRALLLHEYCY